MITIGIVTTAPERHSAARALLLALRSVLKAGIIEAVVLDQSGIADGAPLGMPVTLWRSGFVRSVGEARQRLVDRLIGAGLETHDVIVFLDDDVQIVDDGWLDALTAPLSNAMITGAGGRFVTPDWHTEPATIPGWVDFVGGGWCAIRASLFLDGLEFDPGYVGCYWEDVDLNLQVKAAYGRAAWYCGDIGLAHDDTARPERERQRWYAQNRSRCRQKWAGKGLVLHEIAGALRLDETAHDGV